MEVTEGNVPSEPKQVPSNRSRQDLIIADYIPALVSYMDTELRYTFVNKSYENWFKVKSQDLIGTYVRDLVGDKVFNLAYPNFQRALRGETVEFEQESPYPLGTRYIHVVYTPDIDPLTKEVRGIIALVNDLTDRKKIEKLQAEALEAQKNEFRRLASLFEEAPVAMALLEGPEHRFISANKFYRHYLSGKEVQGKTAIEIFPEAKDQGFIHLLDKVFCTGDTYIGKEARFLVKQEDDSFKEHFLNFIYQAVRDHNGKIVGILAVINDITEQIISRNNLIEQRDIRERFVSTLTHDLRTPLTAAKMSTELLLRKNSDPVAVTSLGNRVLTNIDRVANMVRDLLDANRINAGEGLPIVKENCELNTIVDESLLDLIALHGDRFVFKRSSVEIKGCWDAQALNRVLENLANNAVKYGDPQASITIKTWTKGKDAYLSIHNFGQVISAKDQQTLFNSYKRLNQAIHSGKSGWGIGLSLVRALMLAHEGEVQVESLESKGTTFTIRLPLT